MWTNNDLSRSVLTREKTVARSKILLNLVCMISMAYWKNGKHVWIKYELSEIAVNWCKELDGLSITEAVNKLLQCLQILMKIGTSIVQDKGFFASTFIRFWFSAEDKLFRNTLLIINTLKNFLFGHSVAVVDIPSLVRILVSWSKSISFTFTYWGMLAVICARTSVCFNDRRCKNRTAIPVGRLQC